MPKPATQPAQFVPQQTQQPKMAAPAPSPVGMMMPSGPGAMPAAAAGAPPPNIAPPAPPAKKGPPAGLTMETVEMGKIPADLAGVARSFTGLYQGGLAQAASNPVKRKEMEDNSKKLAILLWRLGAGEVGPQVLGRVREMAGALDRGDLNAANQVQHDLTATAWEENKDWLMATRRLLKAREMGH